MFHRAHFVSGAAAALVLVAMSSVQVAQAQQEYTPRAKIATLHQAALPGVDGREMIVKRFSLPPGHVGGKHMHPGPVYVFVLDGVLTVETDAGTKSINAGELLPEQQNTVMQGKNLSTTDNLELLVIQIGEVGKPMMIKAE